MSARRARRRPRLLRRDIAYAWNGIYPVRYIREPLITGRDLLRVVAVTAVGIALSLPIAGTLLALALAIYPPLLLAGP